MTSYCKKNISGVIKLSYCKAQKLSGLMLQHMHIIAMQVQISKLLYRNRANCLTDCEFP